MHPVALAFLLLALPFGALPSRADETGGEPAPIAEAVTPVERMPAAAPATTANPILLSIPDAGGLRITVVSGNMLHVQVTGQTLPQDIPTSSMIGVTTDSAGYVAGGTITTKDAFTLNNLFGTGLNVKIAGGTVLTITTATATGVAGVKMAAGSNGKGGVSVILPVTDDSGNSVGSTAGAATAAGAGSAAGGAAGSGTTKPAGNKIEVDIAPLTIMRDGTIDISATVTKPVHIPIPGGFGIAANSVKIDYHHVHGGSDDDFKITVGGVTVTAPVPGVLTQNPAPLTFYVATASINTDGKFSFTGASMHPPAGAASRYDPAAEGVRVASRGKFAVRGKGRRLGPSFPLKIPLIKPADFILIVHDPGAVSFDMMNNIPNGFKLTCDLQLPSSFTSKPGSQPDGTDRVTAPGITVNFSSTAGFTLNIPSIPLAYYRGFGVEITQADLDLSETTSAIPTNLPANTPVPGGGVSWEGLYIEKAKFHLPEAMALSDDSGNKTNAPDLMITNCWIDNNGFTGDVDLEGVDGKPAALMTLSEFKVHLNQIKVSVQRNSIKDCDITGGISLDALKDPNTNVTPKIDVVASISNSGMASMQVKTNQIPLSAFNAIMQIDNGTFEHSPDASSNKTVLGLSGSWEFTDKADDVVKGLKVQVKDLQIGSSGSFALDSVWIDMPESANLDFDVVTLDARKIGFGGIGQNRTPWVGFNGTVGIGGGLPIQAQADFEGLFIFAPDATHPHGDVHVGLIGVDCNIKSIIQIHGYIQQTDGTLTETVYPVKNAQGTVTGTMSNLSKTGGFVDNTKQVDPKLLTHKDGTPLRMISGMVAVQLPILGGGADASDASDAADDAADSGDASGSGDDGGTGGQLQFLIARNSWFVMGSFSSTSPLILLGDSGMAIYGFGGAVGYNVTSENPNATGIPAIDYTVIPDINAIDNDSASASGLPNIIALASVRLGTVAAPPAPPPIWGDVTLKVDLGKLTVSLSGSCYLAEIMPDLVPARASDMSRVLTTTLSFDGLTKTFVADGSADLNIPSRANALVSLHAPFRVKIGQYDSTTDAGFDVVKDPNKPSDPGRVFYAKLGGPATIGTPITSQYGITHSPVTIADPVTLTVKKFAPIQGAITLDMNGGHFVDAMKIHQTFNTSSGGDKTKDITIADVHIATIRYNYSLSAEFDALGWLKVDFPGFDANTRTGGSPGLDSIKAAGEFYVLASLKGTASDLNVDPVIGWSFDLPSISITAVLEANLAGSIDCSTTIPSISISGQAYADLGFTVDDHTLSLPFSTSVNWPGDL